MKQVLIRGGRIAVQEMPVPRCGKGEVLVRTAFSLISAGTETATVSQSAPEPAGKVWLRRAKKLGEVARMLARRGVSETRSAVAARLEGPSLVTGYSLAGQVLQVGDSVLDLAPGDRVACAGAASAHHAEIVAVPRNLTVPLPGGMPLEQGALATVGAIALQGVRQADARLGEIVFVLGLGLLGQMTVALLRASGCRVIGADTDASRVERARALGMEAGLISGQDDIAREVAEATGSRGVDVAVITAATASSDPVRLAIQLLRRKGRAVVVGDVGLDLERAPFYAKEAELRISCSYGPGRYDPVYEEEGIDYPYDYVRWTENRNMEEFLRLGSSGELDLSAFIDRQYSLDEAEEAYRVLSASDSGERPLGVLFRYPSATEAADADPPAKSRATVVARTRRETGLGVALVGPGSFAVQMHLPNLASLANEATLRAVVGRTAHSAREVARQWGAAFASTDLEDIVGDDQIDVALICTRHDLHAGQASRALEAGKAVFLEKPAAIDREGLERLASAVEGSSSPFVLGLNRRFAPDLVGLRDLMADRRGPLLVDYRVNAGKLPPGHWALGPQGGGRLIGEAIHMIDLLRFLTGTPRREHQLQILAPTSDHPLGDDFVLTCRHTDGSVTTLTYTSRGATAAGKERIEAHWDGRSAVIDDFRSLSVDGAASKEVRPAPDKGHLELMRRFLRHAAGSGPEPIPWAETLEASRFVLELDREMRGLPPESETDD
jgi:predicted dehydrogenase/threonine dehydrogenase-like Zn-dependent dehydrogenase